MVHPQGLMASVMSLQTSQSRMMGLQASASVREIPAAEKSALQLRSASAALVPLSRKISAAEQSLLQLGTATASAAHVPLSAAATQRSSIAHGARASWIRQYDQEKQLDQGETRNNKKKSKKSTKHSTRSQGILDQTVRSRKTVGSRGSEEQQEEKQKKYQA